MNGESPKTYKGGALLGKTSLVDIAKSHFNTLYDNRTQRISWQDSAAQVVLPLAVGVVAWFFDFKMENAGTFLSGVAIMAGLLCAMAVLLFQLRVDFRDDQRIPHQVIRLIDECMANTLWAIAWGVFLSTYIAAADAGTFFSHDRWGGLVSGLALAGGVHFVLVIAMCLKRLGKSYEKFTREFGSQTHH